MIHLRNGATPLYAVFKFRILILTIGLGLVLLFSQGLWAQGISVQEPLQKPGYSLMFQFAPGWQAQSSCPSLALSLSPIGTHLNIVWQNPAGYGVSDKTLAGTGIVFDEKGDPVFCFQLFLGGGNLIALENMDL